MAWSSAFLAALGSRHYRPTFLLEVVGSPVAGQADAFASHPSLGPDALAGLPRVGGSSIVPISWRPAYGTWSVTVQGGAIARAVALLPRGAVVRLLMGAAGLDRASMEPVALGIVRKLSGTPGAVTVECGDLLSGLTCRWSTTVSTGDLFYAVATSTTVASDYTAGNSTLVLTDASVLQRRSGGTGAVYVEPTVGDPFYLTYTGVSTNTLTGVSSTGAFGSTAVNAAASSTVRNAAYLYGHPCDIVRHVLLSGSGTTDYDVLPDSWGFAIPEDLVDIEDIEDWKDRLAVSSGTYSWDLVTTAKQPTGLSWLQTYLSNAGIWLACRQGRITVRSALDISSTRDMEETITEDDVAGAWSWEWPDPQIALEYRKVRVQAGSTTYDIAGASLETLPAQDWATYDLSDQVFDNETATCTETCRRLAPWATKLPEVVTLPCRGWRLAGLCPGDPVRLDLPRLAGQLTGRSTSYDSWPATVVSVSPDFSRHQTTLRVWPDRESL